MKSLEIWGRHLLAWILSLLFRARNMPTGTSAPKRILVIRLDSRVGNIVMNTPLLMSLRKRFPQAEISMLVSPMGKRLLGKHSSGVKLIRFRKKALLASDGPLRTPFALRRAKFDLVIDSTNPTDPSTTQAVLARFAGGVQSVGFAHPGFEGFYTHTVSPPAEHLHEIDMRLALLSAVPGEDLVHAPNLSPPHFEAKSSSVRAFVGAVAGPYAIINVGARLDHKRLSPGDYALLAQCCAEHGATPIVTWGPGEEELADEVVAGCPKALLAPRTKLDALATLISGARLAISADTGPMHMAVALGVPTLGLFTYTSAQRFGYNHNGHMAVTLTTPSVANHIEAIQAWVAQHATEVSQPAPVAQVI